MANRYWVGGSGDWFQTAHWSTSTGGASGSAVPTSSDDVFIDENSGFLEGGTMTAALEGTYECKNYTANSGHIYQAAIPINIYGSVVLESTISGVYSGSITLQLRGSSGGTIDTDNLLIYEVGIYGTGTWTLSGDIAISNSFTINAAGTFDANDFNVNLASIVATTGTITMGSGTWDFTAYGSPSNISIGESVTVNCETSLIKITSSSILLSGKTYYNLLIVGSDYTDMFFNDSSTWNEIEMDISAMTTPFTIYFADLSTTTVTTFNVNGNETVTISLNSTYDTDPFTLSKSSGTVQANYLNIKNSTATGGAIWRTRYSTDSGNNTGWVFWKSPFPSHFNV